MNVKEASTVFLVLPLTLEEMNDQARKIGSTYGVVKKYPPHLIHRLCAVVGIKAIIMKPVKAGTIPANMKYLSRNVRIFTDNFQFQKKLDLHA